LFVDILSDEFVGVFDGSFLPRRVGIREEDWRVEGLGDQLVPCELAAVVCGDGQDMPLERLEEPDDGLGDNISVLSVREAFHEQEARLALGNGKDEVLAVLYEIHLKVPELFPVLYSFRPLVYGHPVGDVPRASPHIPLTVLEPVPTVLVDCSAIALVVPNEMVNPFHGDHSDVVCVTVSLDLLWRPLGLLNFLDDERPHVRIKLARLVGTLLRVVGEHLRHPGRIVPAGASVPLQLLADSRLRHPYGSCYLRLCLFVFPHSINCVPLRLVKMLHLAFVLETANVAFFPIAPPLPAGLFVTSFITF